MSTEIKIKITFLLLLLFTLAAGYAVVQQSYITHELLPAQQSVYPWHALSTSDTDHGGKSIIDLRENTYNLSADFQLREGISYPYVTVGVLFDNKVKPDALVDWSQYSSIRFRVKCRPGNVLNFVLHSYQDQITIFSDISSFRPSTAFFSCNENWQDVHLSLQQLDTPEWWLQQHKLNLSNQDYALDQVKGFSIASSPQSPLNIESSISVEDITLYGQNRTAIYIALGLAIVVWGVFLYWSLPRLFARQATIPSVGVTVPTNYRQVTMEPKHERERAAVLDYLAAEYVNPNLDVDTIVGALGINRTKINDILREESGLTFSAYLNKLRLTEAARLLSEKKMAVAETAYAVGFGSLSYFNRAFKKEFGCAPSAFKNPSTTDSDSPNSP